MKRSKKFDAIVQQARATQLIGVIKEFERTSKRAFSKETLSMAINMLLQETTRPDKPGTVLDYDQDDQDLLKAAISAAALRKAGLT